ncbi:MAG: type II secretion system major pseudopilin GspG [Gammaproteobacteria bacterium]|nr:type II secretion system major pseudopilin GspG [Gammaproteobacteria bacterium]
MAGRDKPVPYGFLGRRETHRGFSLVELLVVLVILGLLIGLVAPTFMGRAEKSRGEVARVQIEYLHSALKTYRLDIGRYPSTEQGLGSLMQAPAEVADYWHGPYLDKEVPLDPWRNPYRYHYPADNLQGLALYSLGADGAEGGEDDNADIGYLPTAGAE